MAYFPHVASPYQVFSRGLRSSEHDPWEQQLVRYLWLGKQARCSAHSFSPTNHGCFDVVLISHFSVQLMCVLSAKLSEVHLSRMSDEHYTCMLPVTVAPSRAPSLNAQLPHPGEHVFPKSARQSEFSGSVAANKTAVGKRKTGIAPCLRYPGACVTTHLQVCSFPLERRLGGFILRCFDGSSCQAAFVT